MAPIVGRSRMERAGVNAFVKGGIGRRHFLSTFPKYCTAKGDKSQF